ncbi:hypothetical protein [Roseovarius sp. MMSF_3281]|uniref:hypothetical protein n=1 Tax=Roseovarius sp. MMSF_3281 TaxID=3046694 RepID=UPI00273FE522|nr:hypothetical protein [Roseovarius sp. MMSF_3281]
MVSTSKILTVSYGTFSCTLEGFDDSFDTMKAIAEYFRDLAADDRYFGAEPPTPDAEMLARIAEREVARRVDAHEQEGNIVLRAAEDSSLSAPADEPAEQEPAEQAEEQAKDEAPAEEAASPESALEGAPEVAQTPEQDNSADMPQTEVEAATGEPATDEAEEPVAAAWDETGSDLAITGIMAQADNDADAPAETDTAQEPEAETGQEQPVEDLAVTEDLAPQDAPETKADPVADSTEDHAEEAPAPAEAAEEGDSVADRLRRIRSLVDGSEAGFEDTVYSEDEHAQDFLSETAAELDDALSEDDAAESAAQAEADEPDLSSIIDAAQGDAPQQDAGQAPEPETAQKTAKAEPVDLAEDTLAQLLADAMPEDAVQAETEAAPTEAAEDRPEDRPVVQARVVKMKRSEFEAALSEGYFEEDDDKSVDDNLFGDDSGLSAEEEAELQRELAEVEAEFGQSEVEDSTKPEFEAEESVPLRLTDADQVENEATADTPEKDGTAEAAILDTPEPEADSAEDEQSRRGASKLQRAERQADLARIFEEADTQLDAPETNKRRNAIQHLRAAVAATRAEKKAGATLKEDVDDSPYRSDLASVVRPRRPEPSEGRPRATRPSVASSGPAPLKLVAEQRVDVQNEPVRPRRVSAAVVEEPEANADGSNFTEFAEEMGARDLPELLEAAAAYMSDIEGRAQFSRPMLMGKLKEVEGHDFSREDGLRTFGQLLRQGKLQKLKGGRFCVTDNTDFRAEARNVG